MRKHLKEIILFCFLVNCLPAITQEDSLFALEYNFNDHQIKEVNNKLHVKISHCHLTSDRFGNEESAVFLQGTGQSYLNLGSAGALKSKSLTISLWANCMRRVYNGKGYDSNPLFLIKNHEGDDFNGAYGIGFDGYCNRFGASSSGKDSTECVGVTERKEAEFGTWRHFVLTSDNDYLAFYIDGELQGKAEKGFETTILSTDSIMIGHTANKKNFRFSLGSFDDIQIFSRVLNDEEIKNLYEQPNHNRFRIILNVILKILGLIAAILLVAFLLVAKRRQSLKRERERFELKSKMSEMEIKVIKAQINPHFMSNCLSAIQNLIIRGKVEEANEYIAKFGFIVRQVLNFSTKSLVTLSEELEIIKLNVDLERLRFENIFVFDLELNEDVSVETLYIPPLIFQPIIENAIWHGLLPLQEQREAHLRMVVKKEDRLLIIVIEDNGVGRNAGTNRIGNSTESKGIKITTQRIENINHLHNVKTSGIVYEDLLDNRDRPAGTRVIITLPADLIPGEDD